MDENHIKYKKLIDEMDKKMKGLIAQWVLRYDYFGFLFSLIRRRADVTYPNPAAVTSTPQGKLELLFNPILLAATPDGDLHEILHHEGLHILNKHISRMIRLVADLPKELRKQHMDLINIACDCCVNSQGDIKSPLMIAGAPFNLSFPKDHGLKDKLPMEEYYYILLDRMRQGDKSNQPSNSDDKANNGDGENQNAVPREGNSGGGDNPLDDNSDLHNHNQWLNSETTDPHSNSRQIDTYIQRIIRESAKNYQRSKTRGKMPGYLQDLIEKALKPVPIPYYEIIRQWVRGSRLGKYKRSSTHINRKRTYVFQIAGKNIPMISPFPGRKRDMSFKIVVLIDTSGSQTPDDVLDALSGCKNLIEKDRNCEVTVLEVDTIIHKEYIIKKVSDIDFKVEGRGGTKLMAGVERARELRCDVCVCFTDGHTEVFNEIDRRLFPKRMLWVITPNGSDEKLNKTGFVVHLPERKSE